MIENGFEYWYEFLKRSERYKECCENDGKGPLARLYADFGDVHAEAWPQWWRNHSHIFATFDQQSPLREITSIADFQEYFVPDASNQITVILNLDVPKGFILDRLNTLLLDRMAASKLRDLTAVPMEPGKKLTEKEKAKITFLDTAKKLPSLETKQRLLTGSPVKIHRPGGPYVWASSAREQGKYSLAKVLSAYDACIVEDRKPKKERKTRYQIGKEMGIWPENMIDPDTDVKIDPKVLAKMVGSIVSRYFKWGREIIANVERGEFPKHNR